MKFVNYNRFVFPVFLLFICILVYGIFTPFMGFYWDDLNIKIAIIKSIPHACAFLCAAYVHLWRKTSCMATFRDHHTLALYIEYLWVSTIPLAEQETLKPEPYLIISSLPWIYTAMDLPL